MGENGKISRGRRDARRVAPDTPARAADTIAFTLAALLISTVVSNLLQQGFARALLSTVLTFLLVDLLQAFALLPRSGSTAILPMLHLFARETALSCLLLLPVYPALRAIRRIFPD